MAQNKGIRIHQYLDDWLLRAPSREIGLLHTQVLLSLCPTGLAGEHKKVRVDPSTGFHLCRLPVRPVEGSCFANPRKMGKFASETFVFKSSGHLHGQAVHVLDRTLDSHLETGVVR